MTDRRSREAVAAGMLELTRLAGLHGGDANPGASLVELLDAIADRELRSVALCLLATVEAGLAMDLAPPVGQTRSERRAAEREWRKRRRSPSN
ncbi:MAG: hypothetical protein E6J41_05155 [Chloroflexi bacterium]|nr:MAG: hypothetical protein E6J41_05155 [Chloroflexota bacterium]